MIPLRSGLSLKIGLSALFGIIVTLFKVFMPTPLDKIVSIFPQTLLFALASLIAGKGSATLTGAVSGILSSIFRGAALAPFTISFSVIYGISIDIIFRSGVRGVIKASLLTMLAASIIGAAAFYTTMEILELVYVPYVMIMAIILAGALQSFLGAFIGIKIWKRYFERSSLKS